MATGFVDVAGGRLAYDELGTGPLVICAPSMGDVRQEYRFLAPQLAAAGYRAVTLDMRGQGESSTGWADYSLVAQGSDLLAVARALSAEPAILIGTSMAGGAVAWAATEAPAAVAGIVLIDPFVGDAAGMPAFMNLIFRAALARPWGPALWPRYYASLYPTQKPADFAEYTRNLAANLRERGRLEALQGMMFAPKVMTAERLARVTTPALVVMGAKDPDFKNPAGEAQRVAELIHGAVQIIPNAGHYPHAEMPDVTGQVMLSFLVGIRERAAHGA